MILSFLMTFPSVFTLLLQSPISAKDNHIIILSPDDKMTYTVGQKGGTCNISVFAGRCEDNELRL